MIDDVEDDFKDDLKESLYEERMTHVLILYLRYFAQTNLAATILLVVQSCHIRQNIVMYCHHTRLRMITTCTLS